MRLIDRLFRGRQPSGIPDDDFTLVKTSQGEHPAVVAINGAMARAQPQVQARFRWHLSIVVAFAEFTDNGMPTGNENQIVNRVEDRIAARLRLRDNALFIARATSGGRRELTYQVANPKSADEALKELAGSPDRLREWRHELHFDPAWQRTHAVFTLLKDAPP